MGVVQTLAEIYHILEEEGVFLSDAAKTTLPELARQFSPAVQPLVPRDVGRSPCCQRVHPFDGVAGDGDRAPPSWLLDLR